MIKNLYLVTMAALMSTLVGCGSTPPDKMNNTDQLQIRGSFTRKSTYAWEYFHIVKIDDKAAEYPFFVNNATEHIFQLKEGRRKITIEGAYSKGFSTGHQSAYLSLTADLKEKQKYIIKGNALENGDVEAWIEDSQSGKRVSEKVTGVARPYRQPIPILVPR